MIHDGPLRTQAVQQSLPVTTVETEVPHLQAEGFFARSKVKDAYEGLVTLEDAALERDLEDARQVAFEEQLIAPA